MMEDLIPSFSIDHTKIVPGIFLSRQDKISDCNCSVVTTYDIRVTQPNVEPAMDVAAMHTLEHIIATYLRNNKEWQDEVIYWGPMGCLTGFYLILKGDREPEELYTLIVSAFKHVSTVDTIPGATAVNCGNFSLHNLEIAKNIADTFVNYLEDHYSSAIFNYPVTAQVILEDGQQFFDS